MKKTVCAVLLAAVLLSVSMIHGAAADKKGVRLCFIVENDAIVGCADGASMLDSVLKAVASSGEKTAFFFADEGIEYNADYASALMKAFSSGMPVGVYDTNIGDGVDRLGEALAYQKYITHVTSRMILTPSVSARSFTSDHAVYTTDIVLTNPDLIKADTLKNFRDATMVVRITSDLIPYVIALYEGIKTSEIYIITPTDAGFSAFGTEG